MARDHPADVAGAVAAQEEARRLLRRRLQRLLDRRHRLHDRGALCGIETGEQPADLVARAALELGGGGAALGGQRQLVDAAVVFGWLARHDLAPLQALQGPAQEAGVEPEIAGQIGGGAGGAVRDLVDDARFLQREGTVQQLRLDDAELAGVEAAEAADRGDLAVEDGII